MSVTETIIFFAIVQMIVVAVHGWYFDKRIEDLERKIKTWFNNLPTK